MKIRALALATLVAVAALSVGGAVAPAVAQAGNVGNAGFVDVAASDLPGDGTESNPYEISNASELQAMNDSLDAHYELVEDVNATGTADWNDGAGFDPVHSDTTPFTGSLDGAGHEITGLSLNRSVLASVGLFGVLGEGGTVENVHFSDGTVTLTESPYSVGPIVGTNDGTVRDVSTDTTVVGTGDSGIPSVGGVVGTNGDTGVVRNATVDADVHGSSYAGGVVGRNNGEIVDAHATGAVAGADDDSESIGGIVGVNDGGIVRGATAAATVSGHRFVGGAVGHSDVYDDAVPTVRNVTVTGTVESIGPESDRMEYFGGVLGSADGTVRNVTITERGEIDVSSSAELVGGIVGSAGSSREATTISAAVARVPVAAGNLTGGISGYIEYENTTVTDSYATGDVDGSHRVGGLVGENSGGVLTDSYALGNVSGSTAVGGAVGVNGYRNEFIYPNGTVATFYLNGTVEATYAVGAVDGTSDVGGAVGRNVTGTVTESYWNEDTSGTDDSGAGTALTTAQMKGSPATTNMTGFDFTDTWAVVATETTESYPYLRTATPAEKPGLNANPDASDDDFATTENETLSVGPPGVLENDSDADDDALTATVVATPSNGTLDLNTDGSFDYTPDAGFTGEDTFTYEVTDGNGGTDGATVTLIVVEATTRTAEFDVAVTGTNAPVTEGETLSVDTRVRNTGSAAGTQSVALDDFDGDTVDSQSISIDAGNETTVTLDWTTTDGDADSGAIAVRTANDTTTHSVTVESADVSDPDPDPGFDPDPDPGLDPDPNQPPEATADAYAVVTNTTLSMTADIGVLATDSDPDDGDALSAAVESGPDHGTLDLAANGSFVYDPDRGFAGTDTFTYEVSDGDGGADTATVTISVTPGPIVVADPTVVEDATAIRQQAAVPENATPIAAERVTILENESGPTAVTFTNATAVASVLFTTDTSGTLTVVEYADPPSTHSDVPGSILVPLGIQGSPAVENTTAAVRTRVSQTALQSADVTASDVRLARQADGNWELLNTTVVSRDDESVVLEATADGVALFAATAVGTPEASLSVRPTTATAGEELTLSGTDSTTPYGDVVGYEWRVDGQTLTGETTTLTVEEPGEYAVELTVTNDAGQTATTNTTLRVDDQSADGTTTGPAESSPRTEDGQTGAASPGFDLAIALSAFAALAGLAIVVLRRR